MEIKDCEMTEQEKIQELMDMKLHKERLIQELSNECGAFLQVNVVRVIGGWLYTTTQGNLQTVTAQTFVPEPPKDLIGEVRQIKWCKYDDGHSSERFDADDPTITEINKIGNTIRVFYENGEILDIPDDGFTICYYHEG